MYQFTSRVRYSEIGPDLKITPTALITRMQDCSVFHSDSIGKGPDIWLSSMKTWMIIGWQVRMYRMPVVGRNITTTTWPYEFKGTRGYRNFVVTDEDGTLCAEANSGWVYFDLAAGRPAMVPEDEIRDFGLEPKLEFDYKPRRIDMPKEGIREEKPFEVSLFEIDFNQHVNNLRYIDMALGYQPSDLKVKELRAQYIRQLRLGDLIRPFVADTETSSFVSLNNRAGEPCAIVEFVLQ